jgi:hypothetical protein
VNCLRLLSGFDHDKCDAVFSDRQLIVPGIFSPDNQLAFRNTAYLFPALTRRELPASNQLIVIGLIFVSAFHLKHQFIISSELRTTLAYAEVHWQRHFSCSPQTSEVTRVTWIERWRLSRIDDSRFEP